MALHLKDQTHLFFIVAEVEENHYILEPLPLNYFFQLSIITLRGVLILVLIVIILLAAHLDALGTCHEEKEPLGKQTWKSAILKKS